MCAEGRAGGRIETARSPSPDFVGRHQELAELDTALGDARGGRGRLVLLTGDAGIGKSRLAEEAAARAADGGMRVLWGRCWEGAGAPAYWPWVQILRTYTHGIPAEQLEARLGRRAGPLAQLVPEIADRLPRAGEEPERHDPDHARFELFDAVLTFLREAAAELPLVLVLDDLHWADRPSLELLSFVSSQVADTSAVLLGCYRDVEAGAEPQTGGPLTEIRRHGTLLPLRGLGRSEVTGLVERGFGFAPPRATVDGIHKATDGNPFYVDELVRLLVAEGRAKQLAGGRPGEVLEFLPAVPPGVGATIRRRLDLVAPETREVLSLAAVCGAEVSLPVLERAGELPRPGLLAALEEAVRFRILSGGVLGSYAFSHALLRETIYEELAPGRRAELHRRVGEALEEVAGPAVDRHVSEIAHHFFEAAIGGQAVRAVDYAERAGTRAVEVFAFEEGAEHFRRALRALELAGGDETERCRLLIRIADALRRAGDDGAWDAFLRASEAARTIGSPELLAEAALVAEAALAFGEGLGRAGMDYQPEEAVIGLLEDALDAVDVSEVALRSRLMSRLVVELYWTDEVDRRVRLAEEAVDAASRSDDPRLEFLALYAQRWALDSPDTRREQLEVTERMVALAAEVGDEIMRYRALTARAATAFEVADLARAVADREACAELAEHFRLPLGLWQAVVWRANRALAAGDLDAAERLAAEAEEVGSRGRSAPGGFSFSEQWGFITWLRGGFDELEPAVAALADAHPEVSLWRAGLLAVLAEAGRDEDLRAAFEREAARDFSDFPRDAFWMPAMWLLAVPCAVVGDRRRADLLYELLSPYAGQVAGNVAVSLGPVAVPLGILATTAGRPGEAIAHFDRALAYLERAGEAPGRALTHREAAAASLDAGDLPAARRHLDAAVALMRDHGFEGLRGRADVLAERLEREEAERFGFRAGAEGWLVVWEGRVARLPDAKGMEYLHALLRRPGDEVHVLDLVAGPGGSPGGRAEVEGRPGDAGPVIDEQAKEAYRRRLADLEAESEEAAAWNDPERAARARAEIEALTAELARGLGLGGRPRRAGAPAERARVNVTRAIRTAIGRIAGAHPEAGAHLEAAVRTGTFCVYAPPDPVSWTL